MEPTLEDGDRVIVDLWSLRRGDPAIGEVVLFEGPEGAFLVKRVAPDAALAPPKPPPALPAESALEPAYVLLGDNPGASSDSRSFGAVPRHLLRGRVVWRYWPMSRAGRIE